MVDSGIIFHLTVNFVWKRKRQIRTGKKREVPFI